MSIKTKFTILTLFFIALLIYFLSSGSNLGKITNDEMVQFIGLNESEQKNVSRIRVTGSFGSYDLSRTDLLQRCFVP